MSAENNTLEMEKPLEVAASKGLWIISSKEPKMQNQNNAEKFSGQVDDTHFSLWQELIECKSMTAIAMTNDDLESIDIDNIKIYLGVLHAKVERMLALIGEE